MTREEAINEINKVFTPAYANYIVTVLTEGATVSDFQRRYGRAYEAGVKDGLEQKPCEDVVSRKTIDQNIYDYAESNGLSYANLKNAILDAPSVKIAQRWIPVDEELPEESTAVLAWCPERKNIYCAYREVNQWWIFGAYFEKVTFKVTAWKPLPQPYKVESEDEDGSNSKYGNA